MGAENIIEKFGPQISAAGNTTTSTMGSSESYAPGGRWVVHNGTRFWYKGPGNVTPQGTFDALVDGKGSNTDPSNARFYDLNDANQIYGTFDARERNDLMKTMARAGLIGQNQIGNPDAEYNAIIDWLIYSNRRGLSKDAALTELIASGAGQMTTSARTYRTSSTEDLVRVVKEASKSLIGREISDALAKDFATSYQQKEVSFQQSAAGGGAVSEPPSIETAALGFIESAAPKEAAGYKYLGYTNKLFQLIGVQ